MEEEESDLFKNRFIKEETKIFSLPRGTLFDKVIGTLKKNKWHIYKQSKKKA